MIIAINNRESYAIKTPHIAFLSGLTEQMANFSPCPLLCKIGEPC